MTHPTFSDIVCTVCFSRSWYHCELVHTHMDWSNHRLLWYWLPNLEISKTGPWMLQKAHDHPIHVTQRLRLEWHILLLSILFALFCFPLSSYHCESVRTRVDWLSSYRTFAHCNHWIALLIMHSARSHSPLKVRWHILICWKIHMHISYMQNSSQAQRFYNIRHERARMRSRITSDSLLQTHYIYCFYWHSAELWCTLLYCMLKRNHAIAKVHSHIHWCL